MSITPEHLWLRFRTIAVDKVRAGFPPRPTGVNGTHGRTGARPRLLFGMLEETSFREVVGWQVFELPKPGGPASYVAHRTAWNHLEDSRRMHDPIEGAMLQAFTRLPDPTMTYRAATPNAAIILNARRRISGLRLPLALDVNSIVLDGTHYELIVGGSVARSTLRWWEARRKTGATPGRSSPPCASIWSGSRASPGPMTTRPRLRLLF
jgi:hypothetical protein